MLLNDLLSFLKCNIKISQILQQNAIIVQWKEIFARFHHTIMKMEISILYHVVVNSQLNRDDLTKMLFNMRFHTTRTFITVAIFYIPLKKNIPCEIATKIGF